MPTTIISDRELGRGLDGLHPETKLSEGYVVQSTNWLPTYAGTLDRRVGYQRVGGYPPVRVRSITRVGTTLQLKLSTTLSTALVTPTPISLWARISPRSGGGSFDLGGITPSPAVMNFSTFSIIDANTISVSGSPITNTGFTQSIIPSTTISTDYTTTALDAYIWGIPLDWLVANPDATRTTWVTGLFSHNSIISNTPLAVVGRQLHTLGVAAGAAYPSTAVAISTPTVASAQTIGRAIYGATPSAPPTRGWIASPGVGSTGYLAVTSATYNPSTMNTAYVLSAPGLTTSGAISGIIRPGVDQLTVTQSSSSDFLDGTWPIVSVSSTSNTIMVVVANTNNSEPSAQLSDVGGAGRAGVFTDRISVVSGVQFLPGDELVPDALTAEPPDWTCVSATTTSVVVSGVQEPGTHLLPASNAVRATRAGSVFPVASTAGIVRGDVISIAGYTRQFVVKSVNPASDFSTTVVGNGFSATAMIASTTNWRVGDGFLLWNSGPFTGPQVVTAIVDSTHLQFSSSAVATSSTGRITGLTVCVDDSPAIADLTAVTVPIRWVVSTTPDAPNTRAIQTLIRQDVFPQGGSTNAAFVAGAQVAQSTYLTNQFDAVQKFDGVNCYRSGLPWWSPLVGFDLHDQSAQLIQNKGTAIAGIMTSSSAFTATTHSNASAATPGMSVVIANGALGGGDQQQWPTVVSTSDPTTGIVTVDPPIPSELSGMISSLATVYQAIELRYYYRYVGRDINGIAVATGAFSSLDTTVVFGPPCVVSMKLALPILSGARPYVSVELEIYRTGVNSASPAVADGAPPFYRIAVLPIKYAVDATTATPVPSTEITRYFDLYEDSNQISLGSSGAVDVIATALTSGSSVGADWDDPPRALTAASMNGRLLLGNIRSRPELYLALRESPAQTPSAFTAASILGAICVFRRDGATSDITSVAATQSYEFVDPSPAFGIPTGTATTVFNPVVRSLSPGLITFSVPRSSYGAVVGGWIYAGQLIEANAPQKVTQSSFGLDFCGWFQVQAVAASTTYPGSTDVTCFWPEKGRLHVASPSTQIAANVITPDATPTPATNLSIGTPIFFSGVSNTTGVAEGIQYWAIPVTVNSFKVAQSIVDAKAGNAIALTPTGTPFSVSVGYLAVNNNNYFFVTRATNALNIPVPLPSVISADKSSIRIVGMYSPDWPIQTTSIELQMAVDTLSRAINSVAAGNWINPVSGTASRDNWLSSDSGGNYPFATLRVRTPSDSAQWTIAWENTTDDTGREKFLAYAGDARIPNFSFIGSNVAIGTPWISRVGHGLTASQLVVLNPSTGVGSVLPSPLVAGTVYYAVVSGDNAFGVSATPGGSPITLTTAGVGIHKLTAAVSATELRFPARVVRSYPNYPEIFAGPFVTVPLSDGTSGDSVIDVNPADGESITHIRPFYAQSFTIAAQQEARLVVFKNRHVYMVNVETKEISQIQTNGHGGEFPRAIADTRNGIMYANSQGIHKIDRQSQWVFQGQILGRIYDGFSPASAVTDIPVALGAAEHNRVQIAMPVGSAVPTQVITYDYTREVGGENGAWSTFDDYPVTCWTEFSGRTYHSDRRGLVYVDRFAGDGTDYRDDDHSYTSTVLLRPMDFGAEGSRKRLTRVTIQFRRSGASPVSDIQVGMAIDGETTYLPMDSVVLNYAPPATNLSDLNQANVHTISFTPPETKADYFSLSISASAVDEPLEICLVSYHVELLTEKGVVQAGQPSIS